jgi:hypothetical protein
MFALAQLFLDLSQIPEAERSPYENALHRELVGVVEAMQRPPSVEDGPSAGRLHENAPYRELTGLIQTVSHLSSVENVPGRLFPQSLDTFRNLQVELDLNPEGSDLVRLRCPRADCPNARFRSKGFR